MGRPILSILTKQATETLWCVGMLLLSTLAHAADVPATPDNGQSGDVFSRVPDIGVQDDPAPGTSTASPPPPTDEVRSLYEEAQRHYAQGEMDVARRLMEQCYELSHRPNVLYNLAQINRKLGNCGVSLWYYQQYLAASPNGERSDVAQSHIQELGSRCEPKPVIKGAAMVPPAPQPRPASTHTRQATATDSGQAEYFTPLRISGWTLAVGGALAGIGSIYFAMEAQHAKRDTEGILRDAKVRLDEPVWTLRGGAQRTDDFYRNRTMAIVAGTVSAATLASGILMLVLVPAASTTNSQPVSVSVSPSSLWGSYVTEF